MNPHTELRLEKSKLFSCGEMWNGIIMNSGSSIHTSNGTVIEDALAAIQSVNQSYNSLYINNTTFNRNKTGILLHSDNILPHTPVIFSFKENKFQCNAPLNGTVDEITFVGVQIHNVHSAFLNNNNSRDNEFKNIQNGIIASGNSTNLNIYGYIFDKIRNIGIDFQGKKLNVQKSEFNHIVNHGIYFEESFQLVVKNNNFHVLETEFEHLSTRKMIEIYDPQIGSSITVDESNSFHTHGNLVKATAFQMLLIKETEVHCKIKENVFEFRNETNGNPSSSTAINITGIASPSSDILIENNAIDTNPDDGYNNSIVFVWGTKHNFRIINNHFIGGGNHISLWGSSGINNEVRDNVFFQGLHYGVGINIHDVQNLAICSNINQSASNVPYLFDGKNNNLNFSGNITYGGQQQSLWIVGVPGNEPIIGQQVLKGNEWHPGVQPIGNGINLVIHPYIHHSSSNGTTTTDEALLNMSRFFVSEDQSIFNNGQYQFFSKYHPAFINPDEFPLEDVFFQQLNGTPTITCMEPLAGNIPVDKSDEMIANGLYATIISSPALVWEGERHLYSKLLRLPEYQSSSTFFQTFLENNQSSLIEKFYNLEQKINTANGISDSLREQLRNNNEEIIANENNLVNLIDNSPNNITFQTSLNEQNELSLNTMNIIEQINVDRTDKLNQAYSMLENITPQTSFQTYRKQVFEIYLKSQLSQEGNYSEEQINKLKSIAKLCSSEGGMVVYVARSYLPHCDLLDIEKEIVDCTPDFNITNLGDEIQHSFTQNERPDNSHKDLFLYPNPTSKVINILNNKEINGKIEILNSSGKEVYLTDLKIGNNEILLDLKNGFYIIKIRFNNGEIISKKIIINN